MKLNLLPLFLLLALTFINVDLQAQTDQDSLKLVHIVMMDGTERTGYIVSDDGRELLLRTESIGDIYLQKNTIKSITPVEVSETDTYQGDIRIAGPFTTRYQFTTNALPIKKGENYTMIHLYGPEFHAAVSNRLSLGVITTWGASPLLGAVKYTIPTKNEKLNFGFGALVGTSGYLNSFRGYGGLGWGMVTYGDRLRNITFSAGFAYADMGFKSQRFVQAGTYPVDTIRYYGYPDVSYDYEYRQPGPIVAPALSLAGITKIGERSSIFIDAMVFLGQQKGQERIFDFYTSNGTLLGSFEDQYGSYYADLSQTDHVTVSELDKKLTVFYVMPGMRFQNRPNRAFQFTVAGITYIEEGRVRAFPIPNCSWLIKF